MRLAHWIQKVWQETDFLSANIRLILGCGINVTNTKSVILFCAFRVLGSFALKWMVN